MYSRCGETYFIATVCVVCVCVWSGSGKWILRLTYGALWTEENLKGMKVTLNTVFGEMGMFGYGRMSIVG